MLPLMERIERGPCPFARRRGLGYIAPMALRPRAKTLGIASLAGAAGLVIPETARADLWRDVTEAALGVETGEWSNKTDLADIDGDGDVDLLFANGSAYSEPGEPQLNGVWINQGPDGAGVPQFKDVSAEVLGEDGDFSRVIKGRDVNGDGIVDLIVGNTYETQSRLYLGMGGGTFEERTDLLPQMDASVGDLEVGDVDGDGDLDIVLADWGLDDGGVLLDPFTARGARPLIWLNELSGDAKAFVDASELIEDVPVAWAWEIELIDVDGDFDLDIMASSKVGAGSNLYLNDEGKFRASNALPQFTNNYDFEPMFITLPGQDSASLAVVTINDGTQASDNRFDLRERIFVADTQGAFEDVTADLWPDAHNKGEDDNMVVVLDFDSDGDPDFLIGALGDGADRLHVNALATEGHFALDENVGLSSGLGDTPGTLGIALADLNGDGKLDVVQSQGELGDPERIYLGDEIAPDTAPPIIQGTRTLSHEGELVGIVARVHDNKSPSRAHDWTSVSLIVSVDGTDVATHDMLWMGEFLWRADTGALPEGAQFRVCATDAAGNEGCSEAVPTDDAKEDAADGGDAEGDTQGCSMHPRSVPATLAMLMLLGLVRRRRSAPTESRCGSGTTRI